jgi:ribosomal-protein-alanine N-acetyltransferase
MQIVPASWRDLNNLRELERVCFPLDAWPLLDLVSILTLPGVVRLKAEVDGKFAGFIAGDLRGSDHIAWIATIGVLPEYRSRGLATALLKACERRLKGSRVRLCVRVNNESAIRLYEKSAYHRVDVWRRYYNDGADALVMEKVL